MALVYNSRMILNQRGGSIDIDNGTEREKVKISQRSGSNITLTNVVNSELATNNKQVLTVNDLYETVGKDKTEFIGQNSIFRTGENTYELKGFTTEDQIQAFDDWKNEYQSVAKANGQFKISRGGVGYPNGEDTPKSGDRSDNPVIGSETYVVENTFNGYSDVSLRKKDQDDVTEYTQVPDKGNTTPADTKTITKDDIKDSAGETGSKAPGVLEFGEDKSASTEMGDWSPNSAAEDIGSKISGVQGTLNGLEQKMGQGGDEISFVKRNKIEQIGSSFNDFPSVKIDEYGRSQPYEMLVSTTGSYKNHDAVPHLEEVDNSANFPGGNDDKIVCNRYSRTVGSGGIQLKTTGSMELGGTILKTGFKQININASHGIQIASEAFIELQSVNTISLRTNRQVYIESALGVRGNTIIGGGTYIEGELYVQHITAPLEVHQTEDTIVFGKFAADQDRTLPIGECLVGDQWYPVYALASDNVVCNYPHSHHHNGPAMRLTKANSDVRKFAQQEQINSHTTVAQALPQNHEKKTGDSVDGNPFG